jgi:hypothetical protein
MGHKGHKGLKRHVGHKGRADVGHLFLSSLRFLSSLLCTLLIVAALSIAEPAPAQLTEPLPRLEVTSTVQLDEADNVARSHLERMERFLADGQWDEAVETLRGLMDESGDRVTRVPDDAANPFPRYVRFREYCQMRLAAFADEAPEALRVYRDRVDPLAERWYQQGVDARDVGLLRHLTDLLFASRLGDDALFRLGELELDRGHFSLARRAWERLSPVLRTPVAASDLLHASPGSPLWLALRENELNDRWEDLKPLVTGHSKTASWLAYPDTNLDLNTVRARLVLVSILEGNQPRARRELVLLRHITPDAEGTLGGARGRYVELLANLLEASQTWPPVPQPEGWTTFGGSATRGQTAKESVDITLQPTWTVPLPLRVGNDTLSADEHRSSEHRDALLSYYPLVVDDTVLVCTGEGIEDVHAFDLRTGERRWPAVDLAAENRTPRPDRRLEDLLPRRILLGDAEPAFEIGVPRFTMTADHGRVYVKLGPQATTVPVAERETPPPAGYLAALDIEAQKKRLFEIHPDQPPWGEGWTLEGPPVTDGKCLYVALRRRDNLRAQAHVACLDAKRGRLRWRKFIAGADTVGQGRATEYTHNLLTLEQGILYCNTDLGAVAALRAEDGQVQWITRYPREPASNPQPGRSLRYLLRDVTPCLVAQGMVFVAPADCGRLFALDATTGMLLWTTEESVASDVVHLLGVGRGQLLASGSRLLWIDMETGAVTARFPGRIEDDLRAFGRGVLAGDAVYWPTRDRIHVFSQSGPQPTRQPIDLAPLGLTGGNLVIADGVLLIAAADKLVAFAGHPRAEAAVVR